MELIWVLVIAAITINVTKAKSFIVNVIVKVLEEDTIQSDVSESSTLSPYAINRRQNISLFPKNPNREDNFLINLNPTMKTERQATNLEKYRKPFMKKLLIKDKDNVKVTTEVTTRRSLRHRKNFTVRPHDIYSKIIHKEDNWNNRNIDTHNLKNSKSEKDILKFHPDSEENSSEKETQNFNAGDISIEDHDLINIEKQHIKNNDMGLESSKTLLLVPKRNNTNYIKVNTTQLDSDNQPSSNVSSYKHFNSSVKINEDKGKIRSAPEVSNKSHSIKQLEEIIEPEENDSDQGKKDQNEFIYIREDNKNKKLNAKRDVDNNNEMKIRERFRFFSFRKNKST